jgi:diguanylate cyclase (GGDEF)-like protein
VIRFRSLSARLIVSIVATAIITVGTFVTLVLLRADRSLVEQTSQLSTFSEERLAERLEGYARLARSRLFTMLDDVSRRFETVAQRADVVRAVISNNTVAISEILRPALEASDIDGVIVVDAKLRVLGAHDLGADILKANKTLPHSLLHAPIADVIRANDRENRRGYRLKTRLDALTSSAVGATSEGSLAEVMIEPVFDDFGDVVAVLIGHRLLKPDEATLAEFFALTGRSVAVLSSGGWVSGAGIRPPVSSLLGLRTDPPSPASDAEYVSRCVELWSDAVVCSLASASELKQLTDQLVEVGGSQARSLTVWLLALAAASILAFVVTCLLISRQITSPLVQITRAVSAGAKGEWGVPITGTARYDEVGDIARAVEIFKTNAIELLANKAELTRLARTDALTGLPNRMVFRETLDQSLGRCTAERPVAIFYLDLDHFKTVNDTLGHPMGDALLKAVALRLKDHAGERDLVSRLGGDEFAIVQLDAGSQNDMRAMAAALVEILSEPYLVHGHELVIATSVGIAAAPRDGHDPDDLLKCADLALYRAKAEGRRTFRFFAPEMDSDLRTRRALERDLRNAYANQEFTLVYQPIVSLATNRVCAFEALLRWNRPEHGPVPPDKFIPVAEEIGLIVPITEWVLRTACAEACRWPQHIRVAVNLSPVQFRRRLPLQPVINALAASGLPANRLDLELTESVFLQAEASTADALHQLRGFGVRVSMDDFGTGYSALSYLRTFPFDKIKIDRSFINGLGQQDSEAIVELIVKLGAKLNMSTVAEGVATVEQLDRLRQLGCSEAQGYLFSRPVPAVVVPEVIAGCMAPRQSAA